MAEDLSPAVLALHEGLNERVEELAAYISCSEPVWIRFYITPDVNLSEVVEIGSRPLANTSFVVIDAVSCMDDTCAFIVRRKTDAELLAEELFPCFRESIKRSAKDAEARCLGWRYGHLDGLLLSDFTHVEGGRSALAARLASYYVAIRYHLYLHAVGANRNCAHHYPVLPILASETVDALWDGGGHSRNLLLDDHLRWRLNAKPLTQEKHRLADGRIYIYSSPALRAMGYSKARDVYCVNTVQFYQCDDDPFSTTAVCAANV